MTIEPSPLDELLSFLQQPDHAAQVAQPLRSEAAHSPSPYQSDAVSLSHTVPVEPKDGQAMMIDSTHNTANHTAATSLNRGENTEHHPRRLGKIQRDDGLYYNYEAYLLDTRKLVDQNAFDNSCNLGTASGQGCANCSYALNQSDHASWTTCQKQCRVCSKRHPGQICQLLYITVPYLENKWGPEARHNGKMIVRPTERERKILFEKCGLAEFKQFPPAQYGDAFHPPSGSHFVTPHFRSTPRAVKYHKTSSYVGHKHRPEYTLWDGKPYKRTDHSGRRRQSIGASPRQDEASTRRTTVSDTIPPLTSSSSSYELRAQSPPSPLPTPSMYSSRISNYRPHLVPSSRQPVYPVASSLNARFKDQEIVALKAQKELLLTQILETENQLSEFQTYILELEGHIRSLEARYGVQPSMRLVFRQDVFGSTSSRPHAQTGEHRSRSGHGDRDFSPGYN